jgi:hypothetical protein
MRAMFGACQLMWCLGQGVVPAERVTFMHDVHGGSRAERTFAYEFPWVIAGFTLTRRSTLRFGRSSSDVEVVRAFKAGASAFW